MMLAAVRCCGQLSSRKILEAAVCLLNRLCITHRLLGCPPMRNACSLYYVCCQLHPNAIMVSSDMHTCAHLWPMPRIQAAWSSKVQKHLQCLSGFESRCMFSGVLHADSLATQSWLLYSSTLAGMRLCIVAAVQSAVMWMSLLRSCIHRQVSYSPWRSAQVLHHGIAVWF